MLNNGDYCGEITNKGQENKLPYCSTNFKSNAVDPQINQSPKNGTESKLDALFEVRSKIDLNLKKKAAVKNNAKINERVRKEPLLLN